MPAETCAWRSGCNRVPNGMLCDHHARLLPLLVYPPEGLLCPDCASRLVADESQPRRVALLVEHSATCPSWTGSEPELAIELRRAAS